MKLSTKIKAIAMPIAAVALVSAPVFTATSCSKQYNDLFFTVKATNGLEIEFCDRGASIYSMKYGNTYLTYHPKDKTQFVNPESKTYFHGKTLGRVAGRFADGKFTLDDKEYTVQVNEKSTTKNNCLHGGTDSFVYRNFKHYITEDKTNNCTRIAFNYFSPANEAGFPEAVDAWVVYTLYNNKYQLDTTLFAVPTGKTVINLSTHPLFRLANDGNVLDYTLTIPTDKRALYDKEDEKKTGQVVLGTKSVDVSVAPEDKGVFDFRGSGKKIGKDIEEAKKIDPVSGGYDHIWYVGDILEPTDRYVNLYNPTNKMNFKVTALSDNVTGFILYSNDYPLANTIMNPGDKQDEVYAGITIEPYTFFTKSDITPIIYTPDKPFYTKYRYEFTKGE